MSISEKKHLRQRILELRDAIPLEERLERSGILTRKLLGTLEYQRAECLMGYCSMGSEYETCEVLRNVIDRGRHLVLPRVNRQKKTLELFLVENLEAGLREGIWGIREPDPDVCEPVSFSQVDFVLMPGVAFDGKGYRLGYGGGFYDKLLASADSTLCKVAVAFREQQVDIVPREPHDIPLSQLITDDDQLVFHDA